ncbi:MAG: hypothetical protein K9W44_06355 [Candidatus Lokiarchaeota archaeon]|nr:hypothetical protein [Candidatus Harpocratesius repetitus]
MENKIETADLSFDSHFKKMNYYLASIGLIIVVALIVIFIDSPQLQIWSLLAGAAGLIYISSQVIKYGSYDRIKFGKAGIFLEKSKSAMPKDVILLDDIDNFELYIRKSRISANETNENKENDENKEKIKINESNGKQKTQDFKYWLEILIVKRLGERVLIDMQKFISGTFENIMETAQLIEKFVKERYHLDVEIIKTNFNSFQ